MINMGHKIFKISYFLFIALMLLFFGLSLQDIMHFGNELSNSITRGGIIIVVVISIPFFYLVNRIRSEEFGVQLLRVSLILLMAGVLIFLFRDSTPYKRFG